MTFLKSIKRVEGAVLVFLALIALLLQMVRLRLAGVCVSMLAKGEYPSANLRFLAEKVPWCTVAITLATIVLIVGYVHNVIKWRKTYITIALISFLYSLVLV